MPDNTSNDTMEHEVLRIFRLMTDEQKEIFIDQGKVFVKRNLNRNLKHNK